MYRWQETAVAWVTCPVGFEGPMGSAVESRSQKEEATEANHEAGVHGWRQKAGVLWVIWKVVGQNGVVAYLFQVAI